METELRGYSVRGVTAPFTGNFFHRVTLTFKNNHVLTREVHCCEDDDEAISYATYLWYKEGKISKEVLDIIKGYLG